VRPDGSGRLDCGTHACIEVVDAGQAAIASGKEFAVIVAGAPLDLPRFPQRHGTGLADAQHWLELANAGLERANPNPAAPECPVDLLRAPCDSPSCLRVTAAARAALFNDALVVHP
jgi:hypothetical protein